VSTVTAFKTAFATALEARVGLAGVTIYKSEQTVPDRSREHIILGDWAATQEHYAMGGRMLQDVEITCRILIHRPTQDAATARAEALLSEVDKELSTPLDWTVDGNVLDTDLVRWDGEESISADQGRKCEIEFIVNYRDTNE
jgi:hypothetical protein